MNKQNWSRLSVVVHRQTAKPLADIAHVSDVSVSRIVRGLLAEPAALMAEHLNLLGESPGPDEIAALEGQVDLFIDNAYDEYKNSRGSSHG